MFTDPIKPVLPITPPAGAAKSAAPRHATPKPGPHDWSEKHPMPASPKGQAMVIAANLREGLVTDPGDVAHTQDMKNFAKRVADVAPYAPDALALSEVVGPSARTVAKELSKATGHHYVVAANPGEGPYSPGGITHDAAIVVNKDAMTIQKAGFIRTPTPHGANQQASAMLREKHSRLRLNMAAVHYPTTGSMGLEGPVADRWRAGLAKQDHAALERNEGAKDAINVVAGDFNNLQQRDGKRTPMYKAFMKRGYTDSLKKKAPEQLEKGRIDYVFAERHVLDAGADVGYTRKMIDSGFKNGGKIDPATANKREVANPKRYYSDHAFQWSIIGKPRKKP